MSQQKCQAKANCSKYWLNLSVRLSLKLNNCFQTLYEKSNKQLLATFVEIFTHSLLTAECQQKSNKSYQWNFFKVVVLKCSRNGAMNSFFRRKPCTLLTISRKSAETQCLSEFFQVLIKFTGKAFPK